MTESIQPPQIQPDIMGTATLKDILGHAREAGEVKLVKPAEMGGKFREGMGNLFKGIKDVSVKVGEKMLNIAKMGTGIATSKEVRGMLVEYTGTKLTEAVTAVESAYDVKRGEVVQKVVDVSFAAEKLVKDKITTPGKAKLTEAMNSAKAVYEGAQDKYEGWKDRVEVRRVKRNKDTVNLFKQVGLGVKSSWLDVQKGALAMKFSHLDSRLEARAERKALKLSDKLLAQQEKLMNMAENNNKMKLKHTDLNTRAIAARNASLRIKYPQLQTPSAQ